MAVTQQTPRNVSTAAPGATVFPYNFRILDASDLLVTVDGVARTVNVHYTVSGVGAAGGGNVTFLTPLEGGETVLRKRAMPLERLTDYQNLGDLRSPTLNNDQDAPVMMIQQLDEAIGRALRIREDFIGSLDLTFPDPESSKLLGWNVAGDALRNVDPTGPGDLLLRSDLADPTGGGALVAFKQVGVGAALRTIAAKLREMPVSVLDFIPASEHAGIAARTSTYDCADAIRSAINSGDSVYFPAGTYRVGKTINIKKPVLLHGPAGTQETEGVTYPAVMMFDDGIVGIFIHRRDTNASDTGVPVIEANTTGGDGASIQRISIQRGNGSDPVADGTSHGIWLKARALLSDIRVAGFAGNNIHIVASAANGDALLRGNANNFGLKMIRTINAGGDGLYVDGPDANAGYCEVVDASSNGGWGIYDSSFLGNTYVACHTASNTAGAYKSDGGNARNVFLGCYSEGGQPASELVTPAIALGGIHAAGFTAGSNSPYLYGAAGDLVASRAVGSTMAGTSATVSAFVGGNPDNGDLLRLLHSAAATGIWRLRVRNNDIDFNYNNLGASIPFTITGPNTAFAFGRSAPVPHAFMARRLWIGTEGNARQHSTSNAAPASGEWARGDIVWRTNPTAGGNAGWICVTAGTPGTWKEFGAIEP